MIYLHSSSNLVANQLHFFYFTLSWTAELPGEKVIHSLEVTASYHFPFLLIRFAEADAKCHFYIVSVVMLTTQIACKALVASFPGSPRARTKFPYCKRRKAGRGLGARLKRRCTDLILKHIFVQKWLHELSLFPAGMSLLPVYVTSRWGATKSPLVGTFRRIPLCLHEKS